MCAQSRQILLNIDTCLIASMEPATREHSVRDICYFKKSLKTFLLKKILMSIVCALFM